VSGDDTRRRGFAVVLLLRGRSIGLRGRGGIAAVVVVVLG